ncbi:MAG: hypothetical protein JKX97_00175 [Candidatus Lindowbacteria bacterium]|nr:hypothetical protein [Candidatus Lindowbacteria bacterium]
MADETKTNNEGYVPEIIKKGYQPQTPTTTVPTGIPNPNGGYVPDTTDDSTPPPPPDE